MEIFWHGDCIDLGNKTPKEMKYIARQFHAEYPNDDACLDKIFRVRFGNLTECPECKKEFVYKRFRSVSQHSLSSKEVIYLTLPVSI